MTVIKEVAAERRRQTEEEGWTIEHDDAHEDGEMALAAVCYASPKQIYVKDELANTTIFRDPWPWSDEWDKRLYNGNVLKPNNIISRMARRKMLIKAAALIVAEIEREDRKFAYRKP